MNILKNIQLAAGLGIASLLALLTPLHANATPTTSASCVTSITAPELNSDGTRLTGTAHANCAGTIRLVVDHPVLPDYPIASAQFTTNYEDSFRSVTRTCTPGAGSSGWVYTETITTRYDRSPATYIPYCL